MCKIKVSKVLLTRKCLRTLLLCATVVADIVRQDTCKYDGQDIALTLESRGQRLGLFYDYMPPPPPL